MNLEIILADLKPGESSSELVTELYPQFQSFLATADEWLVKAKTIKVTDASQLTEMKLAKESRLAIKRVRCQVEERRKALKEDSLQRGRAIDFVATVIKRRLEPVEAYLLEQEEFAAREEAKRRATVQQERMRLLGQFLDLNLVNGPALVDMTAEAFGAYLAQSKQAWEQGQAEQRRMREQAENERKVKEQEAQRLREENARLRREQQEREQQLAIVRRNEAELKRRDEEQKRKAEQEQRAKEAEAKRLASAPDREKIQAWADELSMIVAPEVGPEFQPLVAEAMERIHKTVEMLVSKTI